MDRVHALAVVGAGLIGAGAARHAAAMSGDVVVIGPDEPEELSLHPGPFASHYDSGRITRHLDPSPIWAELAARSIAEYPTIAAESGVSFHEPVGVVWADRAPGGLTDLASAAKRHAAPLEPLGADQLRERFGWTVTGYGDLGYEGPPAGHIDPRAMRRAQLTAARRRGAIHLTDTVVDLAPRSHGVSLRTASGETIEAASAIIAAGAYSSMVLGGIRGDLPITPIAVAVAKAEVPETTARAMQHVPSLICRTRDDDTVDVYAVPPVRYPDGRWYVKLGVETLPEQSLPDAGAIRRWMTGTAPGWRDHLVATLRGLLPDIETGSIEVTPCVYSQTPTHHPYVDVVASGVVLAAGGNGRAAKSADAIGALAARLALTGQWDDPLDRAAFALPGPARIRHPSG